MKDLIIFCKYLLHRLAYFKEPELELTVLLREASLQNICRKKINELEMNNQISPDTIVIIDSFPLPLCQPVRNYRTRIFNGLADIGYNASKNLWFYGFKVHMLVTLSGYILNYLVTPASVHDIRAVEDLLEICRQAYILADLGYLSRDLKDHLVQKGYHLWTPLRRNMAGAKQHNHWKLMAMRKTIETRFSELCTLFDMEQTLARAKTGLQLRIEQIVLAYNLRYFEIN